MSLGKDLASIRKSKNLSLEDVQNAIKIPHDILDSIEDDSIFSDPNRNKTYLRSFVRSYAKLLKISDDDIVQALDEMETGTYTGSILSEPESNIPETKTTKDKEETPSLEQPQQKTAQTPKKEISNKPENDIPEINWADIGRKFSVADRNTRIWISIIAIIVVIAVVGAGYFLWSDSNSVFEESEPELTEQQTPDEDQSIPLPPTTADTSATENPVDQNEPGDIEPLQEQGQTESNQPATLGDTLTVALYAAYGQLEPVRVTSDLNWRTNPFWMEEGESYNFDFSDTLLVRGQYSRLLLLFNGHVIENPRQNNFSPSFNSILLTRDVLDQPQYLAPPPEEFPLEVGSPDSTVYRIRY